MGKQLLKQYFSEDKKYKEIYKNGFILLMQKGTFYEIYSIDSTTFPDLCSSSKLNITCTRCSNDGSPITPDNPHMAGFPRKSIERFTNILIENNYTIGIMDEHNHDTKITRIMSNLVSPGTYINISNQLMAIYYLSSNEISMVTIDLSTGNTIIYPDNDYTNEYIKDILILVQPKEILIYGNLPFAIDKQILVHQYELPNKVIKTISYQNEFLNKCYKNKAIGITPIEKLNLHYYQLASTTLILLLQFAIDHDTLITTNLKLPLLNDSSNILHLTNNAITQLYIHDLIKYVDYTATPMGKRLLTNRILNPSSTKEIIQNNYDNVIHTATKYNIADITIKLQQVKDLDKIHRKICMKRIMSIDIITLHNSIIAISSIYNDDNRLKDCINYIQNTVNFAELDNIKQDKIIFKDDTLTKLSNEKHLLMEEITLIHKQLSTIADIKLDNSNGAYFFIATQKKYELIRKTYPEITKMNVKEVRIQTPRIEYISKRVNEIEYEYFKINKEIYYKFCDLLIATYSDLIIENSQLVAELDVNISANLLIKKRNFVLPILTDDNILSIQEMKHPLIDEISSTGCVSNPVKMDEYEIGILLYGLNWSGKTSYIRALGINIILAQAGYPVYAKQMIYSPITRLITKIMVTDNYSKQQSSFTNEIKEINNMIDNGNSSTLILADELCSTTEITSALALVATTIYHLIQKKCKFIFTTHYHDLLDIKIITELTNVKSYHMKVTVKDGQFIFDRVLTPGKCTDKYGIEIALHMKMESKFIYMANQIRAELNGESGYIATKRSRYNKDIYMTQCTLCESIDQLHTHHIIPQAEYINGDKDGKDNKSNLIVLCEKCHNMIHSNKIQINKYIDTSNGVIIK